MKLEIVVGLALALTAACVASTGDVDPGVTMQAIIDSDLENPEMLMVEECDLGYCRQQTEPDFDDGNSPSSSSGEAVVFGTTVDAPTGATAPGGGGGGDPQMCEFNCLANHEACSAKAGSDPIKINACDKELRTCVKGC